MTKIKLCGLMTKQDIETANQLMPDYVGFVFASKSRRYITPQKAAEFRKLLSGSIEAVGVFVNEPPENVAKLLADGTIQIAQLHGNENEEYIQKLRKLTNCPIIKAFRIDTEADVLAACKFGENRESAENRICSKNAVSLVDYILLDSGNGGTGTSFDWDLLQKVNLPYFLAGGLNPDNVTEALRRLSPYGVDVSSGIETNGTKDPDKMKQFVQSVRNNIQ